MSNVENIGLNEEIAELKLSLTYWYDAYNNMARQSAHHQKCQVASQIQIKKLKEEVSKLADAETQHLFAIEQLKAELSKYTGPFGKVSVTVTNKADTPVEAVKDAATQNVTLKLGVDMANHKEALSMADYYFARLHGALLATTPVENQAKVDEMVKDFTQAISHALKSSSNCAEPPKLIENVICIPGVPTSKMIGFDKHGRYWVASGAGWKEPGPEFQDTYATMRDAIEFQLPELKTANKRQSDEIVELVNKLNELKPKDRQYMPKGFDAPMNGRMSIDGYGVAWHGYYSGTHIFVAWDVRAQRWFKVNTDAF